MRTVRLGNIASVELSNIDKKSKEGEKTVKLCNFVDVYHYWAITSDLEPELMVATANDNQIAKFTIKKGQVAMTKDSETRDDIGVATYIADSIPDCVLGYHCALISPDESELNGAYLNALLHTQYSMKYFGDHASGSGQRYTLTKETIEDFPVIMPDTIEEQKELALILTDIDSKIRNNNAICADLEGMAKLLYDYWFVQFDFPDENGNPYKSSGGKMVWSEELKRVIPEGWEVGYFRDVLNIGNGKDHKALSDGNFPVYGSGGLMRTVDSYLYNGESVLIPRKGTLNNIMYVNEAFWTVDTMFYTKMKKDHVGKYMYYVAKTYDYERLNTGTGVPSMTTDIIYGLRVVLPPDEILQEFDKKLVPLFDSIKHANIENQQLASLRDFLLPMLMNGQVKVGNGSPEPEKVVRYDFSGTGQGMMVAEETKYGKKDGE